MPEFLRRRSFWLGLGVFVAAAALRLSLMHSARFTSDESRDYAAGVEIARGLSFPLLGPEITGGRAKLPGPLSYWLAAFPQLFTRAPEAGFAFYELMGAASVWMFWFGLRRPFGDGAAAFAAALMALSPWSALYGDHIWNPHAFLFVEGIALLAVLQLRERPESKSWAVVLPVTCLALLQLHMTVPVVWLALLPLALGNIRRWNRRYLAIGLAIGLLLYIPVVIHEVRTNLGNTHAFIAETLGPKRAGASANYSYLLAPVYALRFLTLDATYHELSGYWGGLNESAAWRALWLGSPARPFHPLRLTALLASMALLLAALIVAVRSGVRRWRTGGWKTSLDAFALSAIVAVAADTLLLGVTNKQVFGHYVAPVLPFVFVAYAHLAATVFAATGPRRRVYVAAALMLAAIVCVGGAETTLSISRRIDSRNSLPVQRAVFRRIVDDAGLANRSPNAPNAPITVPVRLEFGFMATIQQYMRVGRYALDPPIMLVGGSGLVYRLQKWDDPPPPGARNFPATPLGSVTLYRLR